MRPWRSKQANNGWAHCLDDSLQRDWGNQQRECKAVQIVTTTNIARPYYLAVVK